MTSKFALLLVVSIFSIKVFSLNVTAQNKSPNYYNYSVATLKTKAQNKDLKAQNELGVRYFYGYRGVSKDKTKAEYWFKKAADNGLGEACANMGRLIYTPHDEKGIYYLRKGASLNDGQSYYGLFLSYRYGDSANRNEDLAREMLMKSANLGDSQGCDVLSSAYHYGNDGFPEDKNQAIFWHKRACDSYYKLFLEGHPAGKCWKLEQKQLQDLGCDYDPALHVDEFNRWLNEKSGARLSSNPSNTANNAATPKSSKAESYVYTKSGRGQSQNTGQWTDAIGSEECVVQFTDDGISVNGMYQPYVKTSGAWKVYGGTSMGVGGSNTTFYYYVDGNKNMKQVCESSSPYGFDTFVYPMSRNGDPTPMGNNVNNGGYVNSNGTNNNTSTGSATQPARQFKCAYCNGSGRIERNDNAPASFGQTRANKKCNECGKIYDPTVFNHYHIQCRHCGGTGNAK